MLRSTVMGAALIAACAWAAGPAVAQGDASGRSGARALIERMDKNGDGRISKDEFQGMPQLFAVFDSDGDGFATETEIRSALAKPERRDTRGDGAATRAPQPGPSMQDAPVTRSRPAPGTPSGVSSRSRPAQRTSGASQRLRPGQTTAPTVVGEFLNANQVREAIIGNTARFTAEPDGRLTHVYFAADGMTLEKRPGSGNPATEKKWTLRAEGTLCRLIGEHDANHCVRIVQLEGGAFEFVVARQDTRYRVEMLPGHQLPD